jgi:hypothetical protein
MRRTVVLEAVGHAPPSTAKTRTDGFHDLAFNLRTVFHAGYIEVHDRPPKAGTNPFLDEYANLLAEGTDELRWTSPGIARGDHKGSESQKLGRIFARAYLAKHGYKWFPDIKDLLRSPERGWSAVRPAEGDMPDWLIGGDGKFAIAEAKGTHSSVHATSTVLDEKWRPQVTNVEVRKNKKKVSLKSWLVATRWVTEDQRKTVPKQYVEDPDPPEEESLRRDDEPSFTTWLAHLHTAKNLNRLAQYRTAARVLASASTRDSIPAATPITWTCTAPGLQNLTFVGRPLGAPPAASEFLSPIDYHFIVRMLPSPPETWRRWERLREALLDDLFESLWFDGLAVPVLTALVRDQPPPGLAQMGIEEEDQSDRAIPGVSLLPDGSLLAPLSLMKPRERGEI